ncbi:MAG: biotin--[acetyl-CoA-carboxylase] ligase [Acholeplasmataceae bacterium]|jgi:biotin transport system substrate-specific component/BirA family biotin operon repressor/biotin-[acetyl-CoA-carboxylase] ligase|nr:biotin--[acetyl-CoA-carboxylase] ligase [Acholeplasmataceae bacterium]
MIPYTLLEFDEIESTSDFLKENHSYFPHMTIIRANHQTGGRGQFDRIWESRPNENILFSVLLKDLKFDQMYKIKGWIVTSLMNFFHDHGVLPTFKEPNDLYINDHKICGILIETQSEYDVFNYAIIGIGLNINQTVFNYPKATSLKKESGRTYDADIIFEEILSVMMKEYKKIL